MIVRIINIRPKLSQDTDIKNIQSVIFRSVESQNRYNLQFGWFDFWSENCLTTGVVLSLRDILCRPVGRSEDLVCTEIADGEVTKGDRDKVTLHVYVGGEVSNNPVMYTNLVE